MTFVASFDLSGHSVFTYKKGRWFLPHPFQRLKEHRRPLVGVSFVVAFVIGVGKLQEGHRACGRSAGVGSRQPPARAHDLSARARAALAEGREAGPRAAAFRPGSQSGPCGTCYGPARVLVLDCVTLK